MVHSRNDDYRRYTNLHLKKLFILLLLTSLLLAGCNSKSNADLFTSYTMDTPMEFMEMLFFYLDNLPYYLDDQTENYYVIDDSGYEDRDSHNKLLAATFENRDEKIRLLIPGYMLKLDVEKTYGDMESEEAVYYKNKLFYLADKMYLSSVGEIDKKVKGESNPKKIVENYLDSIKNADETIKYKYPSVLDYKNVLNYKYIDTKQEKEFKDFYIISKEELKDNFGFDEYESIQAIKDKLKEKNGLPSKVEEYDEDKVKIILEREIKEYDLVYDIELTNQKGEKLYKKILFNISNDNPQNILKIRYKLDISK